LQENSQDLTFA